MPAPRRLVHELSPHIPDRKYPAPLPHLRLAVHNVHLGIGEMTVWNTLTADCSKALFPFQRYCGYRVRPDADEEPALPAHTVLHPPAPSRLRSFFFSYKWTTIPDTFWNLPHTGLPAPAKIFQSRTLLQCRRSDSAAHLHLHFSDYVLVHPSPGCI